MARLTFCDRCGEQTTDYEEVRIGFMVKPVSGQAHPVQELCAGCVKDLRAWIRAGKPSS